MGAQQLLLRQQPLRPLVGKGGARQQRPSRLRCRALHIDRRHHLELAWQRQQQQEALLSSIQPSSVAGAVQDITNLPHLERAIEVSGGALCVLALYSRSCGICKDVLADFKELWLDCRRQRARVVFMAHDVLDEFDLPSDVARCYNVRTVPRFLFLVDGAVVRQVGMTDARRAVGGRASVLLRQQEERRLLRSTLWELLVTHAPGARR
ncbi:hypothetical protein N2152v2_007378 [Parachlorella kessleri]